MSLTFRLATPNDTPRLEELALAGFGPITWARTVNEKFGDLNGKDWKERSILHPARKNRSLPFSRP